MASNLRSDNKQIDLIKQRSSKSKIRELDKGYSWMIAFGITVNPR